MTPLPRESTPAASLRLPARGWKPRLLCAQKRADFRVEIAGERLAVATAMRRGAKVDVECHAGFAEEVEQMRGECHVTPVGDFVGHRAAGERVAERARGDGALEFDDRIMTTRKKPLGW